MKKLISLLVLFCFTFSVFASTGSIPKLEKAMDDYQYALTVEWDQKDQAFHKAKTDAFFKSLSVLMAEGLKKEEILALAEKKMANKQAVEALKLKLTVLSGVKSADELARVLSQNSKEFYTKGASWNGSIDPMTVGIVLVVAAIVGYAIWFSATHECVAWAERYECDTDTYCDDWGCHSDTVCGYVDYCTDWVKKD